MAGPFNRGSDQTQEMEVFSEPIRIIRGSDAHAARTLLSREAEWQAETRPSLNF